MTSIPPAKNSVARQFTHVAFRSSHTGPIFAVTLATVGIGIGAGLDLARLIVLGLAMFADQTSIAVSNDWLDAERDAEAGRTDKPIALGLVSVSVARNSAIIFAALALILTLPLGPLATVVHAIALFAGWSYNLWLKKTPFSVVSYIIGFGFLPLIATLSRPHPVVCAPWALAAGALIGVSAHFANVLPDLADDAATGVRGLPHMFGRKASGVVIALSLASASALIALGSAPTNASGQVAWAAQWVGLAVTLMLSVAEAILALTRPPTRLLFQLIIVAGLIDVVMLAVAGSHLYS